MPKRAIPVSAKKKEPRKTPAARQRKVKETGEEHSSEVSSLNRHRTTKPEGRKPATHGMDEGSEKHNAYLEALVDKRTAELKEEIASRIRTEEVLKETALDT